MSSQDSKEVEVQWTIDGAGHCTTSACGQQYCGSYSTPDGSLVLFATRPNGKLRLLHVVGYEFENQCTVPEEKSATSSD
jgi:hypothetical protein